MWHGMYGSSYILHHIPYIAYIQYYSYIPYIHAYHLVHTRTYHLVGPVQVWAAVAKWCGVALWIGSAWVRNWIPTAVVAFRPLMKFKPEIKILSKGDGKHFNRSYFEICFRSEPCLKAVCPRRASVKTASIISATFKTASASKELAAKGLVSKELVLQNRVQWKGLVSLKLVHLS